MTRKEREHERKLYARIAELLAEGDRATETRVMLEARLADARAEVEASQRALNASKLEASNLRLDLLVAKDQKVRAEQTVAALLDMLRMDYVRKVGHE